MMSLHPRFTARCQSAKASLRGFLEGNDCPPARRLVRPKPIRLSLEERCLMDAGFRSVTGLGNNIANPTWGQALTDLIRISPVAYADGISSPSQPNTLSPRQISNDL